MQTITYTANKVASQFHLDDSFVRLLLGAIRCGKSVANCQEVFMRAARQEPASDGIRYSRWAIVRNTYPDLKQTTIKTWRDWFPEKYFGNIKWDSPIIHHIKINDIDLEVLFISLDRDDDVKKLMSLELTGIYFNELQFISELLFDKAIERVNNYPPKQRGVSITFGGVIADTNPPNTKHWIYERFEKKRPETHKIFKYEPAVIRLDAIPIEFKEMIKSSEIAYSRDGTAYVQNRNADYIKHLQKSDYYLNVVKSSYDEDIRVYYQGEYGTVSRNKRVYPEYNDKIHCVPHIAYSPLLTLGLGWDFGRTPAVVITQMSNDGVLCVLDEICGYDITLDEFVTNAVIPHLNRKYEGWQKDYHSVGDPAGISKNQLTNDCCFDVLNETGIYTTPALSQSFERRKEAVSFFLRRLVSGRPAFLISEKCEVLREGFNGEYYYYRLKISHDERYREEPEKNKCSHPHDGLQYISLYYRQDFDYQKDDMRDDLYRPNIVA